ncbi:6-carboxytetrahydropterin synthase [Planosporangium thailandense]|uniref:6-carboxy-5,6,7,8-tetrahydropterin synthase n=1 Tax=Planosporangium thailandense TaxID=765197 RepID=A0ABX0Y3X6_9ACTN|nr:6-carboxytetrahydropterin synthase [Planosporangium thailandense]NJC73094.1 6-carboxytetrahydropterin synthase [Planosporangium thailandense]
MLDRDQGEPRRTPEEAAVAVAGRPAIRRPAADFRVRKLFDDLPCCHRSWAHGGKCAFLHGYERSFEIEFACAELDPATGFVVDFGDLKEVRRLLSDQFDHTTLVAENDPERELFEQLGRRGVVDLRIMANTGMEGAAEWALEHADRIVRDRTGGRVRVTRVCARESRKNAVTLVAGTDGTVD